MGGQGRESSSRHTHHHPIGRQTQQPIHQAGTSDGFDFSLTSSEQTYESNEIQQQVYLQQQRHSRNCLHKTSNLSSSDGDVPPEISQSSSENRRPPNALDRVESLMSQTHDQQQETKSHQMRAKSMNQQKHRQLQAHVHQQLQRIYGDRTQQLQSNSAQRQAHYQLMLQARQKRIAQQHDPDSQDEQLSSHRSGHVSSLNRPFNNQSHHQPSSSSEQTYDSLSSPNFPIPPPTKPHQNYACRQANQIGAIPEEEIGDDIDRGDGAIQQPDSDDGPDDLLYPLELAEQQQRQLLLAQHSKKLEATRKRQSEIVRKSQLENLHYATVTAAALLNATANAAAAIAATADQQKEARLGQAYSANKQPLNQSAAPRQQQQDNSYQEVAPKTHDCCRHDQEHPMGRQQQQQQQPHPNCIHQIQQQRLQHQMKRNQMRNFAAAAPAVGAPTAFVAHKNALSSAPLAQYHPVHYQQQLHQQQQQVQMQMFRAEQQMQHHRALMSRPIPPQPPARGPNMMLVMQPPGSGARQEPSHCVQPRTAAAAAYRQSQSIIPTALAVLHTGPPGKMELISRMLINNMVASAAESRHNVKGRPDPYHVLGDQMRAPNPKRRPTGQVFGAVVGRASSDSSGYSSAPLVINRDLAPTGFIERLCRIDLTLFWWSLLVISLLFVGITVTISRYVL